MAWFGGWAPAVQTSSAHLITCSGTHLEKQVSSQKLRAESSVCHRSIYFPSESVDDHEPIAFARFRRPGPEVPEGVEQIVAVTVVRWELVDIVP